MSEFESWIEEGISIAGIDAVDRLPGDLGVDICRRAAIRYTSDGLCLRMWEDLVRPLLMFDVKTMALSTLLEHLTGPCWFVPETGGKTKPVYGINLRDVSGLLDACPVTLQFYILGRDLEWLITRSDHGQYYVLGEAISEDLKSLGEYYD
jgi:hypothetical protein